MADQRGENRRALLAERLLDGGGRVVCARPPLAAGDH
jgi:hypothetical protein